VRELLGSTLHDVTQVLESARGSEERLRRVLELLGSIVPYEQCALYHAQPGREPRLVLQPTTPPEERASLLERLVHLHGQLVDERVHPPSSAPRPRGAHLAVPLIGDDRTIGVLFVGRPGSSESVRDYTEQDLRELAIVGSLIAGYLAMVEQARTLDEARLDAEAANRRKDEFLALVSHELKAPLTSTMAWAQILGSAGADEPERTAAVEAIERNVRVQTKLIEEILELASMVTANLRLDLRAVRPASLVEAAIEEQRVRATERSIRLETAVDESIEELVVDPARMVSVISTLLAKAIHVTQPGGRVGVRLERAGAQARIRVTDGGRRPPSEAPPPTFGEAVDVVAIARLAGIPPGVMREVFEAFRARDPVTRAYAELGVGFAIAKTLVEAHGGHVRAEETGQEGPALTVELPLPGEVPEHDEHLLAGIRILIVDDDDPMRSAARAVLEQHGAEVTAVATAAAALAALERSMPHVLLSDLSSPGESGQRLLREVAGNDATLPAVALTAFRTEEDRRRALTAGVKLHLPTPIEPRALVTSVAILTGRSLPEGTGTISSARRC
jgi:signal transduction histidine kinase